MSNKRENAIISLGVLNIDFVMELGNEMNGKKRMGKKIAIHAGGHGSCQAIGAARSGVSTAVIGKIGSDAFGRQIEDTLNEEGVDCCYLKKLPNVHSGLATILVEDQHENTFIDFLGANYDLSGENVNQCREAIEQASLVMIHMGPAVMDSAIRAIEIANDCGVPVLVNPSVSTRVPVEFWRKTDYLVLNMAQAASICGLKGDTPGTARIAAGILGEQVRRGVVIQMDGSGVLTSENGTPVTLDVCSTEKLVDYSGATAFFTGVLAAELSKGRSLQDAAIKAHRGAILCMKKVGVYESFPSAEVLKSL